MLWAQSVFLLIGTNEEEPRQDLLLSRFTSGNEPLWTIYPGYRTECRGWNSTWFLLVLVLWLYFQSWCFLYSSLSLFIKDLIRTCPVIWCIKRFENNPCEYSIPSTEENFTNFHNTEQRKWVYGKHGRRGAKHNPMDILKGSAHCVRPLKKGLEGCISKMDIL